MIGTSRTLILLECDVNQVYARDYNYICHLVKLLAADATDQGSFCQKTTAGISNSWRMRKREAIYRVYGGGAKTSAGV